ncbi:MAG: HAMP domain-containing protein, partial [Deltaproteobacteria bacterium]|nr:HAMP domain-containing protein [Deltaproteobacteria bacterium]
MWPSMPRETSPPNPRPLHGTCGRMDNVSQRTDRTGSPMPDVAGGRLGSVLSHLSIRSSLFLGFGALGSIMILVVLGAILVTGRMAASVGGIVKTEIPTMVHTLRVARAADALAASGIPLAFLNTEAERDIAFKQVDMAQKSLMAALNTLGLLQDETGQMLTELSGELAENLSRLRVMVDERISLKQRQVRNRAQLLANLQSFQQRLAYRISILEGDGDVVHRLMSRPEPPLERVGQMARELTTLLPLSRFYAQVESMNVRLLAASQDSTLGGLNVSRRVMENAVADAGDTLKKIPGTLRQDLEGPFSELVGLALGREGLMAVRDRELRLANESQGLNEVNQGIVERLDAATADLVLGGLAKIDRSGSATDDLSRWSIFVLVLVTFLALIGVVILFHLHVNRHVIKRLSWLSSAMQDVAAGHLESRLPPAGNNELGRLGAALHQFRATASEAREREVKLKEARDRAEAGIKAKAAFLANMSHEIRTPLNAIIGMGNLAMQTDLSPKQRDYLSKIDRAGRTLLNIINDILDFSKIEAGKLDLEKTCFNLEEVLSRLTDIVRLKAEEKG